MNDLFQLLCFLFRTFLDPDYLSQINIVSQYLLSTFYEQTLDSVYRCIKLDESCSFKGVISEDLKKTNLLGV